MTPDKRYVVTIGMSIVPEGTPAFVDYGIRFGDVPIEQLPFLENVANNHKDVLLDALKPIMDELAAFGRTQLDGGAYPLESNFIKKK